LDGSIPNDNPFFSGKRALSEIWSIGHRNPQGAVWNPSTRSIWTVSHGAKGGDEINRPKAGKNYGWPVISYGKHYSGFQIGEGSHKAGMEQPAYYWDPSIAPSGFAYYEGSAFPAWKGNLFVGALKFELIVRLELKENRVVREERLFENRFGRIRDIREGPGGYLYFLTDENPGQLYRVRPN
jgi:glucose/arabinose dehydrogenase